jgi:transketolase
VAGAAAAGLAKVLDVLQSDGIAVQPLAGRWLRATYNRPGYDIFDFNVYALCGDGDVMEGISSEAAALAGHLRLSNLCWIYDSNRVTIEGHTDIAFTEDVAARFLAYGSNVERVTNPNDLDLVERWQGSSHTDHCAQPHWLWCPAHA